MPKRSSIRRGLTSLDAAVTLAVITLLVAFTLPLIAQVRQVSRPATCKLNLGQLVRALELYKADHDGWMPQSIYNESFTGPLLGSLWNEGAMNIPKRNLWFYKLVPAYQKNPDRLICPSDPFADQFDFEADRGPGYPPHSNTLVPSCGYAMSWMFALANAMNSAADPPMWPDRTILFAEVGPDDELQTETLYQGVAGEISAVPWRDGGRMTFDHGVRDVTTPPPWITARHVDGINMAAVDGSVRKARTLEMLDAPLRKWYRDCWRRQPDGAYVCPLCEDVGSIFSHYDFSESRFWWWTGPWPAPP